MRSFFGAATASLLCAVATPADARQKYELDLPPGSLQQAIIALGRQARISIAVTDPVLARITVRRVQGRMTVEQALTRMLEGTAAGYVVLGDAAFRIVRAPPRRPRPSVPDLPARRSALPEEPEIIVTASKREVRLRDYPGAAVVVDGNRFGGGSAANGTAAIAEQVPSLGSTHLGPGRDKLFIRSIADSSFSGQTQATVGQYFGEARLTYNAPDPDLRLYDLASVEVLPGPQGTLYGSGSMGGVLRLVPNLPDMHANAGEIIASLASTAHGDWSHEIAGMANLQVAGDRAAIRLVGYELLEGGYIDDAGRAKEDVNQARIAGGRATALFRIDHDWSVESGLLLQRIEGRDSQYADKSLPDYTRRSTLPQPFSNDYALAHATLRGSPGQVSVTSTFSAADQDLREDFDISDRSKQPALFRQRTRLSLLSTETRLSRTMTDGSGWLAGMHLLRNHSRLNRESGEPDELSPLLGVRTNLAEHTLFGEMTKRLSPIATLTGGLRLSHVRFNGGALGADGQVGVPPESRESGTEWRLLPMLAAAIEPNRDLTIYLRYQQSFRPGGLIVRSEQTQKIRGDRLSAWEAGFRFGQGPNRPLSGSLAVTYARWKAIQSDLIDTFGLPTTINIGNGRIWTIDGQVSWRILPSLVVNANGVINRSEVTNPSPDIIIVDKAPLPNVPDLTARLGFAYQSELGDSRAVTLLGWGRYVGKSLLGVGPILGREQGDYVDTGLEARLGGRERFYFLRATNLLGAVGNRFALGSVFRMVGEDQITPLRPRTLRFGVHQRF